MAVIFYDGEQVTAALLNQAFSGTLPSSTLPTASGGQLLGWNQAGTALQNYAQGGSGGTSKKIAILGDSLTARHKLFMDSWPAMFDKNMRETGAPALIYNIGIDANTFYRSNTTVQFGTNTAVQQVISLAPDVVIIALGYNDAVMNVDTRTLTQIQGDASTLVSSLRTGLPNAKIVYFSELVYNNVDFASVTSLTNNGVIPYLFNLPATGITSGAYGTEMMTNAISSANQTALGNWVSLDSYVKALPIDGSGTMNYWKIARLGGTGTDGLHPNWVASNMQAAYAYKMLSGMSWFATMFPNYNTNTTSIWSDPDTLFTSFLTYSGANGVYTTNYQINSDFVAMETGPGRIIDPDSWMYPYKGKFWLSPTTGIFDASSAINYGMHGGKPVQPVLVSLDGAAFPAASSTTLYTDASGYFNSSTSTVGLGIATGTHTLRYKVGNEIYGPYTLTIGADSRAKLLAYVNANQAITINTWTTISYLSKSYDQGGNLIGSNFTANKTGWYMVSASALVDSLSAGGQIFLGLYPNGIWGYTGQTTNQGASAGSACAAISVPVYLTTNQWFNVQIFHTGSGTPNIIPGSGNVGSFLTVSYMGA